MSSLLPLVCEVDQNDRALIDKLCQEKDAPRSCGNHWFGFKSSCRRGWKRFWDNEMFLSITRCPQGGTAFVRPLGMWKPALVARLAREYLEATKRRVVVKNISREQFEDLNSFGFGAYREGDAWDRRYLEFAKGGKTHKDEEEYPEVIVDVAGYRARYAATRAKQTSMHPENPFPETVLDAKGLISASVGEPFDRKLRGPLHWGAFLLLTVEDLDTVLHRRAMEQVLGKWAAHYSDDKNALETRESLEEIYRSFIFESGGGGWLFRRQGEAVGFVRCADGLPQTLDIHCSLYDPDLRDDEIHTEMHNLTLHLAGERGYAHVGFGGSELERLFKFKRKFQPNVLLDREHAVLYAEA